MILHINLVDLPQANGKQSLFPPYTWELEPPSRDRGHSQQNSVTLQLYSLQSSAFHVHICQCYPGF